MSKKIDFTITEVPGKFFTTPQVAYKLGIQPTEEEVYVCSLCKQVIKYREKMFLDLQNPFNGWRHVKECK